MDRHSGQTAQGVVAARPHERSEAGHLLEAAVEDVTFRDGRFVVAGTDRDVAWSRMARAAYQPRQLPPGLEPGSARRPRSRRPRHLDMPVTPERVWEAIRTAGRAR